MTGSEEQPPENDKTISDKPGDLTSKTMGNFLWMFSGGGMSAVLKIVVLLVLARLLAPEEFGVVSAALTVVGLVEVMGTIGVAPSVVQIKNLTRDHVGTAMLTTLVLGTLMTGTIYIIADPIEQLYRMPGLAQYIEVFSVLFIIKGAGLVSEALMQRKLQFREIAIYNLVSYAIGYAAVAITMASLGYGAWALVFGQIAQQTLYTIFAVTTARERLTLGFSWSTFKSMLRFGFGITLMQIGGFTANNADYFIVGRLLGPEALGFYSRAYLLLRQGASLVGRLGNSVLFATLSSIQDDRKRLQRALNQALALVAMTQIPLTALLVVVGPEIVLSLMGPQWEPAIVPFQILVAVLFFRTAYQFLTAIFRATGRVYVAAIWQWSYATMVAAGAYFGHNLGLPGVAIGVSAAVVLYHLCGIVLVYFTIGVGTTASMWRLLYYAGFSAIFATALVGARMGLLALGVQGLALLIILVTCFVATYALILIKAPRAFGKEGEVLREQITKRLLSKLRTRH